MFASRHAARRIERRAERARRLGETKHLTETVERSLALVLGLAFFGQHRAHREQPGQQARDEAASSISLAVDENPEPMKKTTSPSNTRSARRPVGSKRESVMPGSRETSTL